MLAMKDASQVRQTTDSIQNDRFLLLFLPKMGFSLRKTHSRSEKWKFQSQKSGFRADIDSKMQFLDKNIGFQALFSGFFQYSRCSGHLQFDILKMLKSGQKNINNRF